MAGLLLQWQVWQTILPSITPTGTSAFVEGCEIIRRCCCKNINSTLMLRWKSFYPVSQYHIYSFLKLGVHDFLTCVFGRRDFKRSCSHRRTGSEIRKNTSQTTRENQKTARTSSDYKRLLKKTLPDALCKCAGSKEDTRGGETLPFCLEQHTNNWLCLDVCRILTLCVCSVLRLRTLTSGLMCPYVCVHVRSTWDNASLWLLWATLCASLQPPQTAYMLSSHRACAHVCTSL